MSSADPNAEPAPPGRSARLLSRLGLGMGVLGLLCAGAVLGPMRCWTAWARWGIDTAECPVGTPLAEVHIAANQLGRAQWGAIEVSGQAVYSTDRADEEHHTQLDVHRAEVTLVQADGTRTPLVEHEDGWEHAYGAQLLRARLPTDLPDGDHILEVVAHTRLGEVTVPVDLPVFAPAKVHVLTDRPLYEPGHTVAFRSVVLRARDLVPLGGRPGTFTVRDPQGATVFEEAAPASDWGVAASTVPLDPDAELGTWQACWTSRGASACVPFEVTEFTLPRFTVDAAARSAWSGRGEAPVVDGAVRLASGAPVANAEITVQWRVDGAWTMPHSWQRDGLPRSARTDRAGRFSLALPTIPEDLVGTAQLVGSIAAVDPAGDRQTTEVRVLLSEDDLAVDAVTELAGSGVAESMNNRVWVRATTAAGAPLPGSTLTVRRAWDPTAPPLTAEADADGVAVFQLDPGPPVNVVIAEPPERPPLPPEPVALASVRDPTGQGTVSLADQRALDLARDRLSECRRYLGASATTAQALLVVADGRVVESHGSPTAPGRCLARTLRGLPMPSGRTRAVELQATLQPLSTPSLRMDATGWLHHGRPALGPSEAEVMARARSCLTPATSAQTLAPPLQWTSSAGSDRLTLRALGTEVTPGVGLPCLLRELAGLRLSEPATTDAVGQLTLTSVASSRRPAGRSIPRERVVLGYELTVSATTPDGEDLGSTQLVLPPAAIPDIRLRAEPILPQAGDTVTVTVVRGPDFAGTLPEHLYLRHASGASVEADLDEKTRTAEFELPKGQTGWSTVEWGGAHARIYVAPVGSLDVAVSAERSEYRPGDEAVLTVTTTGADGPVPASVTLLGVDETLQALAPLPGPDAMAGLQAQVETPQPAFGALDGVALVRGVLRGDNARTATVLRVGTPPRPAELDTPVSAYDQTSVSPRSVVVDRFFPILAELMRAERAWEASAPPDDRLDPAQVAELWRTARAAAEAAGHPTTDAYGEPLTLHRLPPDLLDLTSPHGIVTDGARLPDDLENWPQWVAREEPR